MKKEQIVSLSEFPFPSSQPMERQVLADLVSNPEEMQDARMNLRADTFADEQCRQAWEALCDMQDKGQGIDLASASARLERDFFNNAILPLTNRSGSIETRTHYLLLASIAIRKMVYQFGLKMLQEAANNAASLDGLLSFPEEFASTIRGELGTDAVSMPITDAINSLADTIQQEQEDRAKGRRIRVPTGIGNLDWVTYGGFGPGQLVVVAARPSVGKTAIALSMAREAAAAGVPAAFFSLEMTRQELAQRLLLSTGKITPQQIASGKMEWADFDAAAARFNNTPLFLNDASRTIDEIASRIILSHQHNKCGIAFIDYLGLLDFCDGGKLPLYQQIAIATKRLKQTAMKCRIPIVLLSQLNRASATDNRPPQLFDLRDSGSIEQDADIVLMLERQEAATAEEDARLNMWIRKNRHGKAAGIFIELQPDSTYTNFADLGAKRG